MDLYRPRKALNEPQIKVLYVSLRAYLGCHCNPWLKNIFLLQYLFITMSFYRNIFLSQYCVSCDTPGVNFIIILHAKYESTSLSFSVVTVWFSYFLSKGYWQKSEHKMLMKLTPGVDFTNIGLTR